MLGKRCALGGVMVPCRPPCRCLFVVAAYYSAVARCRFMARQVMSRKAMRYCHAVAMRYMACAALPRNAVMQRYGSHRRRAR